MERAATLRVITASGTAQQFFLRVSRDGDGTLTLTLCDGCTTWGGTVRDSGITPPKLGMTHTDFAERLLDGLQGAPGTEADEFSVTALHDDGRLLSWSAERQGKLGTKSVIKQEVSLALERPARPGAGLMELLLDEGGAPDYDNVSKTPNGRVSYPIHHIPNHEPSSTGGHPQSVIFLTCDAFGVLPPVSKLNSGQVRYQLITPKSTSEWKQ